MTTPGPDAYPNVQSAVGVDRNPEAPAVVVRFATGGAEFVLRLDPRKAPEFMAGLAQAVIQVSTQAVELMGPQLLVPSQASLLAPEPDLRRFRP